MSRSLMFKSYNGVTGFGLASVLHFLTGERPIKHDEINKELVFFVSDKFINNTDYERISKILEAFQNFYGVKIKSINEL